MDNWKLDGNFAAPVDVGELRKHARIIDNDVDQDDVLNSLIETANDHLISYLERSLLNRTIAYTADSFSPGGRGILDDWWYTVIPFGRPSGGLVQLPVVPVSNIDSFQYVDSAEVTQSLTPSDYILDADNGRLQPSSDLTVWPQTAAQINAVTITYTAGYGDAMADIPARLRTALYMLVGHWYENRESYSVFSLTRVPDGFHEIVDPFRRLHV